MVSFEYEVYTALATALRAEFPDITVGSVPNYEPKSFPYVCIEESDNHSYLPSRDTASNENHVVVMYEINAFSNKINTKKSECKSIMAVIDNTMNELGFTRRGLLPTTIINGSVFRMAARYDAVISPTGIIYRR